MCGEHPAAFEDAADFDFGAEGEDLVRLVDVADGIGGVAFAFLGHQVIDDIGVCRGCE